MISDDEIEESFPKGFDEKQKWLCASCMRMVRDIMLVRAWGLAREAWCDALIAKNRRLVHGETFDEQDEFEEWKAEKEVGK